MKISFERWHEALQGTGPVEKVTREVDNEFILANNSFFQMMKKQTERAAKKSKPQNT